MKVPQSPPRLQALLEKHFQEMDTVSWINNSAEFAVPGGRYLHWEELRRRAPPEGLSHDTWWLAVKLSRLPLQKGLPFFDPNGRQFTLGTPDPI